MGMAQILKPDAIGPGLTDYPLERPPKGCGVQRLPFNPSEQV